jgi:two-component system, chemotaxis family, sensor kinase Cph1
MPHRTDDGPPLSDQELWLAALGHDLRAPLHTAIGYLDVLEAQNGAPLATDARQCVESATASLLRVQVLLARLLEWARADKAPIVLAETDVHAVVQEAVQDLQGDLRDTGGEVFVDVLPVLRADGLALRQVFQNLIANALRHGGRQPRVTVSAERDEAGWRFRVHDEGPGIPAEERQRILQPFRRGSSTAPGSGLGLAICMRLVERHGGSFVVEDPPAGATFSFTIPQ